MFKEFNKSCLENGMVLEVNKGYFFILIDGVMMGETGFIELSDLNNELVCECANILSVKKVYKVKRPSCFRNVFKGINLELLWQRDKEIDWGKVPEGTKVQVKDHHDKEWVNRYFSNFKKGEKMPFSTWLRNEDEFTGEGFLNPAPWKYCRIHPSIKIKEEWYK